MYKIASIGDEVEILYRGKLKDQTVFDSTDEKGPFKFTIGSDNIIKGINEAVIGMKVGDKKTIELLPEVAYGKYNEKLLAKIPRINIPNNANIGDVLTDSNGNNWWVRQIDQDHAIVDGNHPLSGQTLIFDIELVRIN